MSTAVRTVSGRSTYNFRSPTRPIAARPPTRYRLATIPASSHTRRQWRGTHRAASDSQGGSGPLAVDPFEEKQQLRDGALDRLMIKLFTQKMADQLEGEAVPPAVPTFDDFVAVSRLMVRRRNSAEQQAVVGKVLDSLLPPFAPTMFRLLFPFHRWSAELNAQITKVGFAWLVGPMEITEHEVTFGGEQQVWASGVKIQKCRYLEGSGCVGMCTNMCKIPTQKFFCETFGIPLTMSPNFEDLSCQCVFGAEPPPLAEDPCYSQPCFTQQCSLAAPTGPCPKIDTTRLRGKGPEE